MIEVNWTEIKRDCANLNDNEACHCGNVWLMVYGG